VPPKRFLIRDLETKLRLNKTEETNSIVTSRRLEKISKRPIETGMQLKRSSTKLKTKCTNKERTSKTGTDLINSNKNSGMLMPNTTESMIS
jgi:hypothetical protein